MIKIYIFADSYKHFEDSISQYKRRLGKKISIKKLKPSKKKEARDIIKEETDIIKSKLSKENGFKILLNPRGKILNTYEFTKLIEDNKQIYPDTIFVIGGAYGFNYELLEKDVHLNLSLGGFIMPHILSLLVLVEQVYRADMIEKGTSYHK